MTHAAPDEASKRIQVFDDFDKTVSSGDNTVIDTEQRQTEHQPFRIVETENEKLITIIKRVRLRAKQNIFYF